MADHPIPNATQGQHEFGDFLLNHDYYAQKGWMILSRPRLVSVAASEATLLPS